MTTDDEQLLREMWCAYTLHATPKPFLVREAMAAVLAVVRAHDSASPTALANSGPKERQEAFDALKEELDDALAELAALRDKALRFDLDQAGIARRDADAAELVELRAELAALRAERDALLAAVEAAPHAHFCLGDKFRMADGTRVNMCNCWKRPALGER